MNSHISIEGLGDIKLIRSKKSRQVRLKIDHDGRPVVTAPTFVPVIVINKFVKSKADWINQHGGQKYLLGNDDLIGRWHKITVNNAPEFKIRVGKNNLSVNIPANVDIFDDDIQKQINKKAQECLRKEAQLYMPGLVADWSQQGAGHYNKVSIKLIRSRWGSYSSDGNISLSLFMAQLPDRLIDYVVVHELCHSVHMNHSKEFWDRVGQFIPDYKQRRKELRNHNMRVIPS